MDPYLHKLANLNANKNAAHWTAVTTYRAPHKPLLLLTVLELLGDCDLTRNLIELNTPLVEGFGRYWQVVNPPSARADICKPFFHLKSEGFWHLLPVPGAEDRLAHTRTITSLSQLTETVLAATLDQPLYEWWCTEHGRSRTRELLITTYFDAPTQARLWQQIQINTQAFTYSQGLLFEQPLAEPKPVLETAVRDQGFRRAVTTAYDHRCAFCGVRILTADGHTAIEAAHIIPWATSHNDSITNGLALCRLCHWGFDEGLLAVGKQYRLLTSTQLQTVGNLPGHLATLDGRTLLTPTHEPHWPHPDHLHWHRQHIYRR